MTTKPVKKWWFVLGREPLLSAAEIIAVLKSDEYELAPPFLTLSANIEPTELMKQLGGTIKIARELGRGLSEAALLDLIGENLKSEPGKINFGLSFYGPDPRAGDKINQWGKQIKNQLKASGKAARYMFNREPILSAVTVQMNKLTERGGEFLLRKNNGLYDVAKTAATQPFDDFGARDYGRPGRDGKSGMLPPKLAMMMINLAAADKTGALLDPFCGSGTIITEAMLLGFTDLIGTDLSEKAVENTKKNIAWIRDVIARNPDGHRGDEAIPQIKKVIPNIQRCDINNLSKIIKPQSIDAIVTEPHLGKPLWGNERAADLQKQADELANLYVSAFREFSKILKPKGVVIFIIPEFQTGNNLIKINCLEKIKALGFKQEKFLGDRDNLTYQRPGQHLRRVIYKFTYAAD